VPGNVTVIHDDGTDGRVVQAVHADRLEVAPAPVLVQRAQLRPDEVPGPLHELAEQLQCVGAVVRMDELERVQAHVFGRTVAEHRLRGLAGVQHRAVRPEQHDDVARVLDQGAEPLLARVQPLGCPLAIGDIRPTSTT